MYVPHAFEVSDREAVLRFIERHGFATLVTQGADGPEASHVPLLLERAQAPRWGRLLGHVARANLQHERFDGATPVLAIFHGPHAYVSPAWYARHPAVPTWNYGVVHAYGRPRTIGDDVAVEALLGRLVEQYEAGRPGRWRPDLPEKFAAGMRRGIVAFALEIERVEAKFKLGQNRPPEDRAGALAGLEAAGDPASLALAAFTREALGEA
jgi:transcriptional regulator